LAGRDAANAMKASPESIAGFAYFMDASANRYLEGRAVSSVDAGADAAPLSDFLYVELICAQGVGSRLLMHLKQLASYNGKHLLLSSLADPLPFYRRFGFDFVALVH
jgi:GNAT superfamily N-acetyltransferase